MACAVSTKAVVRPAFDLDRGWQLDPRVSIRRERFGALLYHFGTRRLSFLKSPVLLDLVRSLEQHPCARDACAACDIAEAEVTTYQAALATLASSTMIIERPS